MSLLIRRGSRELPIEREEDLRGGDVVGLRLGSSFYPLVLDYVELNGSGAHVFYSRSVLEEGSIDRWRIPSSMVRADETGRINGEQLGSSAIHTFKTGSQQYADLNTVLTARGL